MPGAGKLPWIRISRVLRRFRYEVRYEAAAPDDVDIPAPFANLRGGAMWGAKMTEAEVGLLSSRVFCKLCSFGFRFVEHNPKA